MRRVLYKWGHCLQHRGIMFIAILIGCQHQEILLTIIWTIT